jgi:hypothetical protein
MPGKRELSFLFQPYEGVTSGYFFFLAFFFAGAFFLALLFLAFFAFFFAAISTSS